MDISIDDFNVSRFKGTNNEIGYQHGKELGSEILRVIERFAFALENDYGKGWEWFRSFSNEHFYNKIDNNFITELENIAAASSKYYNTHFSKEDLITLNCIPEIDSYFSSIGKNNQDMHCSSFIANGEFTRDGDYILGHTTWWRYYVANSFNHLYIIIPEEGFPFAMQSAPGLLFSFTDFYYNSKGIAISETTIDGVNTFNLEGEPLFQRLRNAIQYSSTVEDVISSLITNNNGAYANDYLIGSSSGIALLELGTYNYGIEKKNNGYFVSSNKFQFENLQDEVIIKYDSSSDSDTSRFLRLRQLIDLRGLDPESAKKVLSDHFNYHERKDNPGKNSICGHREIEPGLDKFDKKPPYFPTGSIDAKIVTGKMAINGSSIVKWGKPCNASFNAETFLSIHPEYSWLRGHLEDIIPGKWKYIDHGWNAND